MLLSTIVLNTLLLSTFCHEKPFWIEHDSNDELDSFGQASVYRHSDDLFETAYAGIITFAHLPFVNCLTPSYTDEAKEKFDIAIIGAPFDTSVTYRPGYTFPR